MDLNLTAVIVAFPYAYIELCLLFEFINEVYAMTSKRLFAHDKGLLIIKMSQGHASAQQA